MSTLTMRPIHLGGWRAVAMILSACVLVLSVAVLEEGYNLYNSYHRDIIVPVKTLPAPELFNPKAIRDWTPVHPAVNPSWAV